MIDFFVLAALQLEDVHFHVEKYFERFRNLLGPGNRRYIQTLMVLCRAFLQILCSEKDASYRHPFQDNEKTSEANSASCSSMAINDFLFSLNIDNINLIKLLQYLKESNIMHKVNPPLPGSTSFLIDVLFIFFGLSCTCFSRSVDMEIN